MIRKSLVISMLWIAAMTFSAVAEETVAGPLTLRDCYNLALKRSETIAIQKEVINEAKGRFLQSLGTALPQVSFVDTEKRQDASSSGDSTSSRSYTPTRYFTFTQPLFSGFKEFAAMSGSKSERKQREEELLRAQQLLFTDVSDAFYFLKGYQEDLKTVNEIHAALEERAKELVKRVSVGRSRESEKASTDVKLYQSEADMELVKSQAEVARQLLEFLIGQKVSTLVDDDMAIESSSPVENYLAKADARPDVKAAQHAYEVAQKKISVAKAGYLPNVNVVGNSYVKRVGPSSGVDWDVSLNVNVPIFNGTSTFGEVKEARAQAVEAKLRLTQLQRQAELDIQNAYTKLESARNQALAYKKTVDAAQKNYDLQKEDYQRNAVNNLDVLQALQDLQTIRRNYISVKNEANRSYWNLQVAAGDLSR